MKRIGQMMRRDIRQIPLAVAALLSLSLAGCTADGDGAGERPGGACELRLHSGGLTAMPTGDLPAATRAVGDNIPADEKVLVWADEVTTPTVTPYAAITAWQLTADGSGGLTGEARYFPPSGNALNLYALHGTLTNAGSVWNTGITHTVAANQIGGTATSDLLYACYDGAVPSGAQTSVALNFYHLLTKIRVALTTEDGTDLAGSTLTVNSGGGTFTFTPTKLTATALAIESNRTAMVSGATKVPADITMPFGEYTYGGSPSAYGEAVIIPQTYADEAMLTLTTTEGDNLSFRPASLDLLPGKVYTLHLTVDIGNGKLSLVAAITPWEEGSTDPDGDTTEPLSFETVEGSTVIVPWKNGSISED